MERSRKSRKPEPTRPAPPAPPMQHIKLENPTPVAIKLENPPPPVTIKLESPPPPIAVKLENPPSPPAPLPASATSPATALPRDAYCSVIRNLGPNTTMPSIRRPTPPKTRGAKTSRKKSRAKRGVKRTAPEHSAASESDVSDDDNDDDEAYQSELRKAQEKVSRLRRELEQKETELQEASKRLNSLLDREEAHNSPHVRPPSGFPRPTSTRPYVEPIPSPHSLMRPLFDIFGFPPAPPPYYSHPPISVPQVSVNRFTHFHSGRGEVRSYRHCDAILSNGSLCPGTTPIDANSCNKCGRPFN